MILSPTCSDVSSEKSHRLQRPKLKLEKRRKKRERKQARGGIRTCARIWCRITMTTWVTVGCGACMVPPRMVGYKWAYEMFLRTMMDAVNVRGSLKMKCMTRAHDIEGRNRRTRKRALRASASARQTPFSGPLASCVHTIGRPATIPSSSSLPPPSSPSPPSLPPPPSFVYVVHSFQRRRRSYPCLPSLLRKAPSIIRAHPSSRLSSPLCNPPNSRSFAKSKP